MDSDSRLSKKRRLESPVALSITGLQVPRDDWDGDYHVEMDAISPSFVDRKSTNATSGSGGQLAHAGDFKGGTGSTAPVWCFGMVVSPKT